MLVKLGGVWVDPRIIGYMNPTLGSVAVSTSLGSFVAHGVADEFAEIVNNALNQQSFGGEVEAEEPATP